MKNRISGNYLVDEHGGVTHAFDPDGKKFFAAFVQCGHCGTEYFIPSVMTSRCNNVNTAKELISNTGRVKKGRKGVIMDIFEVTQSEAEYILESNYIHDPYFRNKYSGIYDKRNEFVQSRRVIHKDIVEKMISDPGYSTYKNIEIRTRDKYDKLSNAFESNFAPIRENGKLEFPDVDRNKALSDYYRSTVRRFGVNTDNPFVLTHYYIMFGAYHLYGIHVEGNCICYSYYKDNERIFKKIEIPEPMLSKLNIAKQEGRIGEAQKRLQNSEHRDPTKKLLGEFNFDKEIPYEKQSRTDRFKARIEKTAQLQKKMKESMAELESENV